MYTLHATTTDVGITPVSAHSLYLCFNSHIKPNVDGFVCRSEKSPFASKRLNNVIEFLTFEVFRYTGRGLYENHKFLLVLFLTLKKDLQTGYVKHQEFQVFIKGRCFVLRLCLCGMP